MFRFPRVPAPVLMASGLAIALASCAPKAPPPPPPPPPPKVVIVPPPKPIPPNGASDNLVFPPADQNGLRVSVNRNITTAQMLWNLRSAYNVAALNCSGPAHAEILPRYRAFLTANAKVLTAANKKVDAEFKSRFGTKFVGPREEYMTSVYNHFALPPTLPDFCDAVLAVSRDAMTVKPLELEQFAVRSLPNIEVVFDDFYRRYEKYRTDLAEWNARFGQTTSAAPTVALPQPSAGGVSH